jgi:glycosyltransferase involved in cell wall biosynthesis
MQTQHSGKQLRIGLDARPLSHPQAGGFRTYVRSLLHGFSEILAEGQNPLTLILYVDRPLSEGVTASLPPGTEVRVLHPNRIRTDWQEFPRQVKQDSPDLVQGTMNYMPLLSGRTVLTIHDAMGIKTYPWEARSRMTPREWLVNRYWYAMTLLSTRRANRIVTVSQASAEEIAKTLGHPAQHFSVVHNGVDLPTPTPGIARKPGKVLLFHSPDIRKNTECLYRALSEHRTMLEPLITEVAIVCTSEQTAQRAQNAVAEHNLKNVTLLRGLSDQALSDTYASASVFLWASRLEGFGLPPLEAMRNGCPVISSSAPAMPEVLGATPLYFNPTEPRELAEHLRTLLCDQAEQERRSHMGRAIAQTFTCRRMATQTLTVWKEVLA